MEKGINENIELPDIDFGECGVIKGKLDAAGLNFGIVVSRFNMDLTGQLLKSAVDCLKKYKAEPKRIEIVWVPGAYEVPLAIEQMAAFGDFDALIALGCVIQGETPHADLINTAVANALLDIGRQNEIAVINEVVGTYNLEQAEARCKCGEQSRGWYAGAAAIEMARALSLIGTEVAGRKGDVF